MPSPYIPSQLPTLDTGWKRFIADELRKIAQAIARVPEGVMYVTFEPQAIAPMSPQTGQTYFDAPSNKLKTFDGTIWRDHW